MNIDFATLCLISIPGFLIGLTTGRFISGSWWKSAKRSLGGLGRLLSGVVFTVYLGVTLITLAVMFIYLANLPENTKPINFWLTTFFVLWIVLNVILDLRGLLRGKENLG